MKAKNAALAFVDLVDQASENRQTSAGILTNALALTATDVETY